MCLPSQPRGQRPGSVPRLIGHRLVVVVGGTPSLACDPMRASRDRPGASSMAGVLSELVGRAWAWRGSISAKQSEGDRQAASVRIVFAWTMTLDHKVRLVGARARRARKSPGTVDDAPRARGRRWLVDAPQRAGLPSLLSRQEAYKKEGKDG